MTVAKLDHLEDRIQKPAYLLFLVVVLLFLIIGLVDLIDHSSNDPTIFGRYSLSYMALLGAYTLLVLAWSSLLLRPNDNRWLLKVLDYIQYHPLLAIVILAGIAVVLVMMVVPKQRIHSGALQFPALQATVFVISLLVASLILFYKWGDESRPQLWRKIVVGALSVLLLVELAIQVLALLGILPGINDTSDTFAPYSRVYQTEEGFGNGITNKYGRFVPEYELRPDAQRVAIVGDSFIQGLQVKKDENLGFVLQGMLNDPEANLAATDIITVGYPEYGPGMYLSNWMLDVVAGEFEPENVMVFFDLGSDFQVVDGPGYGVPYFEYAGQGKVSLNLENFFTDLHNKEHDVFHGHEGFQLVRLLGSHYLTPRVIAGLAAAPTVQAAEDVYRPTADIDMANGFVFDEDTNDEAMIVAKGLLGMGQEQLALKDISMSLVTIPAFSEAFFGQQTWNTVFGESDLLLPERELRQTAALNEMPFLGLGTYMAWLGMTPEEVKALYFDDGRGRFTPAGHALAAEATFKCFFEQSLPAEAGCDIR